MRAGSSAAGDLHVDRCFSGQQIVVAKELFPDLREPLGRILSGKIDADAIEAPPQPIVVEPRSEEMAPDCAEDFINAVAKNEAAVLDGDPSFLARHELTVDVYD